MSPTSTAARLLFPRYRPGRHNGALLDIGTPGLFRRMGFMPSQTDRIAGLRYHQKKSAAQAERAVDREAQAQWDAIAADYARRADEAEREKS